MSRAGLTPSVALARAAVLACAAVLAAAPFARAQADGTLELDDVLASVQQSYPRVLAALADRREAAAQLRAARGGFDPVLEASGLYEPVGGYPKQAAEVSLSQPTPLWGSRLFAGYRVGTGEFASYEGKLQTLDAGELRAGVQVPLLRDGAIDARRAGVQGARIGVGLSELSVEQQKIEARRAASLRYFEWVAAGQRLQVVREWLELARRRDRALAERVERGEVAAFERVENQRAILQRESAQVAAERDLMQAAVELSLFVRGPDGVPRVPGEQERPAALPEPTEQEPALAEAIERALQARPDVLRFELQRSRGELGERLASNQRLPGLRFDAAGSKDVGTGDPKLDPAAVELKLLFDFPLLNRAASGRAAAARAALSRIDAEAQLARDRAAVEVRSALLELRAARERATLTAQELQVARELASGELQRFDLGESTLLLVNLREQASAEAELRHVEVLADYHRTRAELRAAVADNAPGAGRPR